MKRALGVLAAMFLVSLAPVSVFAQAAGPAGDWELEMTTPQGTNTVGLSISLTDDKAAGQLSSQVGSVPVEGTVTGNVLALTAALNIQGMELVFGINGTVDGDTMSGTVKVGDFGEFPFTGKRAVKAAPTAAAAAAAAMPITDLNGRWDITLVVDGMGEIPATAVLKQDGEVLTGTLSGPAGDLQIAGTVTGKAIKIDFEADTPQGKVPITMTGDIGETSVTGKASIAGLGEANWTATRAAVQQ